MQILVEFIKAFLIGGVFCAIGQVLIDKTNMTPARILSIYVVAGVILGGIGIYQPLAAWAGAGAAIPLTGFGNTLAKGIKEAVAERGAIGIFTGGLTAASGGITAAIVFAFITSALFKPKDKK